MKQEFRENLMLALDTLRSHKLRSFLTVLGVVIGVAVIIVVGAMLAAFEGSITDKALSFGRDTAFISKEPMIHFGRLTKEERMRKPLTLEMGQGVLEAAPAVKAIAISLFAPTETDRISYKTNEVVGIDFRGTFPAFVEVYANATLKEGRFFIEAENDHREDVVVIGEDIEKALFPGVSAVDHEVRVHGTPFRVIGVFQKPKGGFGQGDTDKRVLLPYYTFRKMFPNAREHGFRIQAGPGQLDLAVDQARAALRRLRRVSYGKPDDFEITTNQQVVAQFKDIISSTVIATIVLSSIGLLIGGVGVMNIMLVSVTERTREIGVRKAIGARRSDVTWQFLLEAMTLTGAGGILGILFGAGLAMLIPAVTSMQASVPLWSVAAGLAVSISVGLIFGVWPAVKASRLDPVIALRYE